MSITLLSGFGVSSVPMARTIRETHRLDQVRRHKLPVVAVRAHIPTGPTQ